MGKFEINLHGQSKKEFSLNGPTINDVGNVEGGGVKHWPKLLTDRSENVPSWGC